MKIEEVFTPRTATVNLKTYVPRLSLEMALSRSVQGSLHSVLFGESGNGKSWLYKKVFQQQGFHYKVANCANACRIKSISDEIRNAVFPHGSARKTGHQEIKEATDTAFQESGAVSQHEYYSVAPTDPLLDALAKFRSDIGPQGDGIIVLENLEAIFDQPELMNELGNILLLLDDPVYGGFRIKFLLVGVPNGVIEYFAKAKNIESVANRIAELPKVDGLTLPMVETLVEKGFNQLLKFNLSPEAVSEISLHTHHVTLGVAQRVQEYCEKLAYRLDDAKRVYSIDRRKEADQDWLGLGLRQAYAAIESHLNSKQTTVARRNQVIFCIGRMTGHQIDSTGVVEKIKVEFPSTAKVTNMGIGSILAELANSDTPILRKNPKTKDYFIADPRYLMCIRVMLFKNATTNAVEKRAFRL